MRGLDLNQRPSGYEPDELPGCSTPRQLTVSLYNVQILNARENVCRVDVETIIANKLFYEKSENTMNLVTQKPQGQINTYYLRLKF